MLTITVKGKEEEYDEEAKEFVTKGDVVLTLEHSLVSLSKWEEVWEKPFLGKGEKTSEEVLDYIKYMILTENPPADILFRLSEENVKDINNYIDSKRSATWFHEIPSQTGSPLRETITTELIYYWMLVHNIPFECANWHLNRLLTLIKICNLKSQKPKKMSQAEMAARNRALNEQRKNDLNTRG